MKETARSLYQRRETPTAHNDPTSESLRIRSCQSDDTDSAVGEKNPVSKRMLRLGMSPDRDCKRHQRMSSVLSADNCWSLHWLNAVYYPSIMFLESVVHA